jgi:hypothetical protein
MKKVLILAIALLGIGFAVYAADDAPPLPDDNAAPVVDIELVDAALAVIAPEEGWKKPVITGGINISQNGFYNWVSGGENSLAWQASVDASADYTGKIKWSNMLKLKYGQIQTESSGTRKSDDEIKIESIGEYNTGILLNPYVGIMAQTQMMPGYEYSPGKVEISKFMDPGYIKESAGGAISIENVLTFRLGAAIKHTVAPVYSLRYNGAEDVDIKTELGIDFALEFNAKFMENLLFKSLADSFSNFTTFDAIDIKLDNTLTAKINELFNVNLNFVIVYDKDLSKAVQAKETLSLGITYNFL